MRKNNSKFNAISAFTDLSKMLEDSNNEILRLYSEDLAKIPYDSKNYRLKINSYDLEQLLRCHIENLGAFLKTTPIETMLDRKSVV